MALNDPESRHFPAVLTSMQRARNIATFKWPCVYIKKKIKGELEFTDNQLNTMSDLDSLSLTSVKNISSKNPGN